MMRRHIIALIVVCMVIVAFNLAKLESYDFKLHSLVGSWKETGRSAVRQSFKGYHQDDDARLIVIEKEVQHGVSWKQEKQFWEFPVDQDVVEGETNVRVIEGYDYNLTERMLEEVKQNKAKSGYVDVVEMENAFQNEFLGFFDRLYANLKDCAPSIEGVNNDDHYRQSKEEDSYPNREGRVMVYGGFLRENYVEEPIRTKNMLANYLRLSEEEINDLKASHSKFISNIDEGFPEKLLKATKFNHFMKGDGIVYLGGSKYDQLAFLSIRTLRAKGSKLPVEVIIPNRQDYDIDFCENVLPSMNGHCKIMEDYLPPSFMERVDGFQYKNVALMISSFERILYLDADNIPIKNPDVLFSNEPFTSQHLVIWPDIWRRSTSPTYYDIAGIEVNEGSRVRNSYFPGDERGTTQDPSQFSFHDCDGAIPEASSETGQLLINKKVHYKTLLLSMYYNFYGPDYYYPLFSQGAAGEGDKETFIAAAHKLNLPYYQVKEFNREFGPLDEQSKKHEYFAMGQYDPIIDYIQQNTSLESYDGSVSYYTKQKPNVGLNDQDTDHNNYDYHVFQSSSLFFLHANWPKYAVNEMFIQNSNGRGPRVGSSRRRLYDKILKKELHGFDFELEIARNLKWCFCELKHFNLIDVPTFGSKDRNKICSEIEKQISFLKKH